MLTIALLAVLVPSAHARAAEDAPELSEDFAAISYSSLFRISGSHQLYAEASACVLSPPVAFGEDGPPHHHHRHQYRPPNGTQVGPTPTPRATQNSSPKSARQRDSAPRSTGSWSS